MDFTLNGEPVIGRAARRREPARGSARGLRAVLGQGRVRARRLLRRVHRPRRRACGRRLRAEGGSRRGEVVTTQEGLSAEDRRLWGDCLLIAGASQCGYCTPGHPHEDATAFLGKHPEPTRDEVKHALLGNLCRCTGYVKIIDAVLLAAAARRGEPLPVPRATAMWARAARAISPRSSRSATSRSSATWSCPGCCTGRSASPTIRALASSGLTRRRRRRIPASSASSWRPTFRGRAQARFAHARTGGSSSLSARSRPTSATCSPRSPPRPPRGARGGGARRGRVRGARTGRVPYEALDPRRSAAARGRQRPLDVGVKRGDADAALASSTHVVSRASGRSSSSTRSSSRSPRSRSRRPAALHVYSQGQGVWDDRRQIAAVPRVPEERGARRRRSSDRRGVRRARRI